MGSIGAVEFLVLFLVFMLTIGVPLTIFLVFFVRRGSQKPCRHCGQLLVANATLCMRCRMPS